MRGRRLAFSGLAIAAVLLGAAALAIKLHWIAKPTKTITTPSSATSTNTQPTNSTNPQTANVKVYFSKHPDSDNDPTKVFAVDRQTNAASVATFAITQLMAGPTTDEVTEGFFTQVAVAGESNCGGNNFQLSIKNTQATLQFCKDFTAKGVISDAQGQYEINRTLLQFPTITSVVLLTKDGHCLFDESGMDRCKQ